MCLCVLLKQTAAPRIPYLGFQVPLVFRLMEEGGDAVHELIAGGPVAGPVAAQGLALGEDLLHHQLGRAGARPGGPGGFKLRQLGPQAGEVSGRVGQAVDVVDA